LVDTALPFQDLVAIRTASSCTISSRAESFLKWGSQMIHPWSRMGKTWAL